MKIGIIYNPHATGLNKALLKYAENIFQKQNAKITLYESKYPRHVIELTKIANENNDLIVSMGGDGTLGEVFIALGDVLQKAKYIHIPTGTANDTADNFGLHKGLPGISIAQYANLNNCDLLDVDMLTANDVPFGYVSACGTFTNLTYDTPKIFKENFGKLGYYIFSGMMGITTIPDIIHKPLTIAYEKNGDFFITDALTMIVSNSKTFAGFKLFKNAKINDGIFEISILKKIPLIKLLPALRNLLNDKTESFDFKKYEKYIDNFQTNNFKVTFLNGRPKINHDGDEAFVSLDDNDSLEYKNAKKIKMLLPKKLQNK